MKKIKANYIDRESGCMEFDHFTIRRKGNNCFAIFDNCCEEITSAKSLNKAAKKAKLLEMGFNIGINYRGY